MRAALDRVVITASVNWLAAGMSFVSFGFEVLFAARHERSFEDLLVCPAKRFLVVCSFNSGNFSARNHVFEHKVLNLIVLHGFLACDS